MRQNFSSYYRPSDEQFAELWRDGTFVFDANVLLDLYSYAENIRSELFSVLEKLSPRIWIPYHVGLEYQRNRLSRIKQVHSAIAGLQHKISKGKESISTELEQVKLTERQLGLPDLDDRLNAIGVAHDRLLEAVELASKKLPKLSLDDPIRDRLSQLFSGRVGSPPDTQDSITCWVADAEHRTKNGIPPGFRDQAKDTRVFRDRSLEYEPKHGDLILWKQLLEHIESQKLTRVAFVTRDTKDDWWVLDGSSTQTIGPRPELVQEAHSRMQDGIFWAYQTAHFLKLAGEYLRTPVSEETISRVTEVSESFNSNAWARVTVDQSFESRAESAVLKWLASAYPGSGLITRGFPDFVIRTSDGLKHGFELKCIRGIDLQRLELALRLPMERAQEAIASKDLDSLTLVIVPNPDFLPDFESVVQVPRKRLRRLARDYWPVTLVFGKVEQTQFNSLFTIKAQEPQLQRRG